MKVGRNLPMWKLKGVSGGMEGRPEREGMAEGDGLGGNDGNSFLTKIECDGVNKSSSQIKIEHRDCW